jgi:type I restriction enzyme, S subunit
MLPKGWRRSIVRDACMIKNNLRLPLSTEERMKMVGTYPYFGPTGVLGYIDRYRIDEEFALIGEDGDHFLKFRHKPMTFLHEGKANVNNHAHIIGNSKHCSARWFYYWFMHRDLTSVLSRQGVGRYKLTKAGLEKLEIFLPPPDEQDRICRVLNVWEDAITTTECLLNSSYKQKQALAKYLLLPNGSRDGWRSYRLGDLFSERNEAGRDDLPLLSITRDEGVILREDVGRKDTSNEDKSKYLRICKGDIGYNTMRMWQGVSAMSMIEGIVSPAYTVLVPTEKIDARYAAYLFKVTNIVFKFYRHSQGMVSDTWSLKYNHFSKIVVTIPCRSEQERIVRVLSAADEVTSVLGRTLEKLRREKLGLMQQLLTGKRRIKGPNKLEAAFI